MLGVLVYPNLAFTVDPAQVLAGVVEAPTHSPAGIFDRSAYSLFSIQLPAVLLWLGLTVGTVSTMLSGIQVALAFSAVTLLVLSFSRSRTLAILVPLLMLHVGSMPGHKYPIFFPTSEHNGALLAFYAALAGTSLLALDRTRSGALLVGLLPAFNPALGIGGWVLVGGAIAFGGKRFRRATRAAWPYAATGALTFLLTFAIQAVLIADVPHTGSPAVIESYTRSFIEHWDVHRRPLGSVVDGLRFFAPDMAFVVLALVVLYRFRDHLPAVARPIIFGLFVTTAAAASFTIVDELWPDLLPLSAKAVLIPRWLNWNTFVLVVLVLALLGRLALHERSMLAIAGMTILSVGVVAANYRVEQAFFGAAGLLTLLVLVRTTTAGAGSAAPGEARWEPRQLTVYAPAMLAAAVLLGAALSDVRRIEVRPDIGPTSASLWDGLESGRGRLIVGPPAEGEAFVPWVQLRSGRDLVLNVDSFDTVAYVPEAVIPLERILQRLYGTSVTDPAGTASFSRTRARWEERSREQWQSLSAEFRASEVLADADWRLDLPRVATSGGRKGMSLYRVPVVGAR